MDEKKHVILKSEVVRYRIIKKKKGLWRLDWEDGSHSLHSTEEGAREMIIKSLE